ncbi:hypothetical protein RUM44_008277 [Polyplax serrata]|uniref:Uncharacterized protein n=1 Tax=Polyplax serrata TaxID=468196 RepID=A0ABR1BCA3_POLSC
MDEVRNDSVVETERCVQPNVVSVTRNPSRGICSRLRGIPVLDQYADVIHYTQLRSRVFGQGAFLRTGQNRSVFLMHFLAEVNQLPEFPSDTSSTQAVLPVDAHSSVVSHHIQVVVRARRESLGQGQSDSAGTPESTAQSEPVAVAAVVYVVDVQVIRYLVLLLPLVLLVLHVLDANRYENQDEEYGNGSGHDEHVESGYVELEGAVVFVLVETGRTMAKSVAPQRRTDAGVQFGTSETCDIIR